MASKPPQRARQGLEPGVGGREPGRSGDVYAAKSGAYPLQHTVERGR
jgi:hypothetical protein